MRGSGRGPAPRAEPAASVAGQYPGRHHVSVHTGTGLLRSHRRKAKSLASMMLALRAQPAELRPTAWQTHAEASDVAADIKAAATTSDARVRPIQPSSRYEGMDFARASWRFYVGL